LPDTRTVNHSNFAIINVTVAKIINLSRFACGRFKCGDTSEYFFHLLDRLLITQQNKPTSRNFIVKKLSRMLIVALMTPLFSGCPSSGSSAPPPSGFTATAGDGRVKVTWTPSADVDYWLFSSTDPNLSAFNWLGLPNLYTATPATTPFYMCGLYNGTTYYFAANGRINGGPGGSSSATLSATPYDANQNWAANAAISSANIYGVGYTSLTACTNNSSSAAGSFSAVGASGAIYNSTDGINWLAPASVPSGLPDLYAVTGYAALRVAVGDQGTSVYSTDGGDTWIAGAASSLTTQPLRSISEFAGTFFAVGDAGTILSSVDGNNWVSHGSDLSVIPLPNLYGVSLGSVYAAVGESGTMVTSVDGGITWTAQTAVPVLTTSTLRQVASIGGIIVAVGDGGTIVTSKDSGATWVVQTLSGTPAPNLVGVTVEYHLVANDVVDGWLGVVPTVQFVAVDSSGNAYVTRSDVASANGLTWSSAITTGTTSLNTIVSSGFGYVAAGNAGANASAF
jgi:photosystem II stability/assembly factor-like uncharacterized protein